MAIFYNPSIITENLVLCLDAGNSKSYPGSGTTWTDIIGRGNTGTLTNSPTYSSQNGGSIVFNGETNYVENLSPNLGISGDTSVTLSCWFFNSVNSSNNQALLVYGNGSTGGDSISILLRNLSFYASFNGGLDAVIADNVYALNTWNNVVVTKTPGAINTTTKLYLNGIEQTITSASSSTPSLSSRVVRVARWTDDASPYYFLGGVSAALIYNRALSAAEVLQNYNSLKNRFVTAPVLIPVGPYRISRSLRFNSADSAYLNRTPSVAGNRKTWTWAGWVKRSSLVSGGVYNNAMIFSAGGSNPGFVLAFDKDSRNDAIQVNITRGTNSGSLTAAVFRDFSAWFHLCLTFDTTQTTASDRVKLWINGSQQVWSQTNYPNQNTDYEVNNTSIHNIGRASQASVEYFNGYLADVHFIDGQALTPSSFTEINGNTGQLVPKDYSGSYNLVSTVTNATGALPIYNTTGTYGAVKGSGTRTDTNASSLVLAIPMDGANNGTTFTDESANIKGSGTAKTITNNGSIPTLTAQSKFYGSSAYISNAGTQSLAFGNYGTDFQFTGDFTIECWVYPTTSGATDGSIFVLQSGGNNYFAFNFDPGTQFNIYNNSGSPSWSPSVSTVITGQWNHLAFVRSGSTQQIFVNGASIGTNTASGTLGYSSADFARIGGGASGAINSYIQDFRIYKGVAKYTANFTPPIPNNSFRLNFSNNSATTAATLGADSSGNGNNWTPNNLSVTAGAGNDSLTDTPTSYGTDTGAGGEVRGNYATLNPTNTGASNISFSNGNLDFTSGGTGRGVSTISMVPGSGKFYCEFTCTSTAQFNHPGIYADSISLTTDVNRIVYRQDGNVYTDGAFTQTITSFTNGNIIGMTFNADTRQLTYYKNGSLVGGPYQASTPPNGGGYYFHILSGSNSGCSGTFNFGQRPFAYPAPTGFKCLCDTNLPTPTIAKGSSVFDTTLYTGNGGTQTISGLGFSPDLVWIKGRSGGTDHALYDTVRGATFDVVSNSTAAETTQTQGLTAFNSNGFSVGTLAKLNTNAATYAGWCWDAGTSTVTNTAGTITSQVRANASAGFSVVTFTTPGSGAFTVGHGLGVVPSFIITKARNFAYGWSSYHISIGLNAYIELNTTASQISSSGVYGTHTSTVASYGSIYAGGLNEVTYCFAPVTGYSSFGSYTGNGSADGSFTYLGLKPAFILIKRTDTTGNWVMLDGKRAGYNVDNDPLYANLTNTEATTDLLDITSNGFKLRTTNADCNASGGTYIYAAFAENPFQFSRAR
jgi:hypothetical protein